MLLQIEKNMKFFLHHTTQYSYSNPVVESANKILLYPFNDMNQQLVNHKLTISGNPDVFTYLDDFNNRVGFFTYTPPHKLLVISSEAEILSKKFFGPAHLRALNLIESNPGVSLGDLIFKLKITKQSINRVI